jgi:hypothetical protein
MRIHLKLELLVDLGSPKRWRKRLKHLGRRVADGLWKLDWMVALVRFF